jgi:predicted ATPase
MQRNGQLVLLPEYLRLEAGILVAKGEAGAEQVYLRAIDLARTQSALAWELRAALGLARLYQDRDPERARQTLMPVYGRFTEGFETADLRSAKSFLSELGCPPGGRSST